MPQLQPQQLSRAEIGRRLEAAFWDTLVFHLRAGLDLPAARLLASEAKTRAFALIVHGTAGNA
jgi:hypothetical protein